MTIKIETAPNGHCRAIVDGNMTIYEAAIHKPALIDALAKAEETEIDLSSVREMDTAGLQLLILAKRESLKRGKVMRLIAHSAASLDVVRRYNLAVYLASPTVPHGRKKNRRAKAKGGSKR